MPVWKRILCAVDLSDASRAALREAARVTRNCADELTLLHVSAMGRPMTSAATDPFAPDIADVIREDLAAREADLQPWREEAARLSEKPVAIAVVHGAPANEVVAFARDRGFDLLVVATHGRTGFRRLVLGSVAERVIREATVPVLVVRAPGQE